MYVGGCRVGSKQSRRSGGADKGRCRVWRCAGVFVDGKRLSHALRRSRDDQPQRLRSCQATAKSAAEDDMSGVEKGAVSSATSVSRAFAGPTQIRPSILIFSTSTVQVWCLRSPPDGFRFLDDDGRKTLPPPPHISFLTADDSMTRASYFTAAMATQSLPRS